MNDLNPDAFRQAGHDARAKPAVTTGTPQAALTWILRLAWKVKLFLAAVLMFLAYAAVTTVLETTGLRPAVDTPAACNPALPLEEHARCIRERRNAMAAREKAEQDREAEQLAREEAEQKKLDDEVQRQQAIADAQPLKAAFDKRLMEIMAGPQVGRAAADELAGELSKMLWKYLNATDHPVNQTLAHWKAAAQGAPPSKINPPRWGEARDAIDKACATQEKTRGALIPCAEAIKLRIERLPWSYAEHRLESLVRVAAQRPPSP